MSEIYPNELVKNELSQLESNGYTSAYIVAEYEKCLKFEMISSNNNLDIAQRFAIRRVLTLLAGSNAPEKRKFWLVGYTAQTRFGESKPKQTLVIAPVGIVNGVEGFELCTRINLEGDELRFAEKITSNAWYHAELSKKKFGGYDLRSKMICDKNEPIPNFAEYLERFGIRTLNVPQAQDYQPAVDSKGFPTKFELFNLVVRVDKEPNIIQKNDPLVKSRQFRVYDGYTPSTTHVDNRGYTIVNGIDVYCHPDFAIGVDIINTYSIIGTISKSKTLPSVTTFQAMYVYNLTNIRNPIEERSV